MGEGGGEWGRTGVSGCWLRVDYFGWPNEQFSALNRFWDVDGKRLHVAVKPIPVVPAKAGIFSKLLLLFFCNY